MKKRVKMNIKRIVKLSFLIIALLVIFIFFANSLVLYQIKENNLSKKNLSELISMQEGMSKLLDEIIIAKKEEELEDIANNFLKYEKNFEAKYQQFFLNQKNDLVDYFIQDIHKYPIIEKNLAKIVKNEKVIESFFEEIFFIQSEKIKYTNLFKDTYPKENTQRKYSKKRA